MKRFAILSFDEGGAVLSASTVYVEGLREAVRAAPACAPRNTVSQKLIGNTRDIPAGDLDGIGEILGPPL